MVNVGKYTIHGCYGNGGGSPGYRSLFLGCTTVHHLTFRVSAPWLETFSSNCPNPTLPIRHHCHACGQEWVSRGCWWGNGVMVSWGDG